MNSTIIPEEKLTELKRLVKRIEIYSLPFPPFSAELEKYEKKQIEEANEKIYEIIKTL